MAIEREILPPLYSRILLGMGVLIGLFLCYLIMAPFLASLVWALTLAMLFSPVEHQFRARLRSPALATSVTIAIATVLVIAPALFVAAALLEVVVENAGPINAVFSPEARLEFGQSYKGLSAMLDWLDGHVDLPRLLESATSRLQAWGENLILGSITGIINLLLTFYFLFYMLRDRNAIISAAGRILPFTKAEFDLLADRMVQTIFATVYGTLVVSVLQGVLGGLVFWWLALPSPLFWGVIMGLLAIVPFLGAFIVWVPAALLLALNGQWVSAAILVAWGTLVVGLIDNLVYPVLVGRRLAIHSALSFIAIVGGIVVFGAHGFVLGPLIVAGTGSLLEILRKRMIDAARIIAPDASDIGSPQS